MTFSEWQCGNRLCLEELSGRGHALLRSAVKADVATLCFALLSQKKFKPLLGTNKSKFSRVESDLAGRVGSGQSSRVQPGRPNPTREIFQTLPI